MKLPRNVVTCAVVAFAAACVPPTASAAGGAVRKATGAGIRQGGQPARKRLDQPLRAFIREIDRTYPFFQLKGIWTDWRICKKALLEKVRHCESNNQFYALLDEARRCLRDPHIRFRNLKGQISKPDAAYYPGVSFLPAVDGQVVIMHRASEHRDKFGPGTVVTRIDGRSAREILEGEAARTWKGGGYFSSPQRARLYAYRIPLQGKKGESHELTILKDGKTASVRIANRWQARGWPHTYAMPQGLTRLRDCRFGTLRSGCGYIHLRRLRGGLVNAVDQALKTFDGAKGLIIDLRGNGGGGYGREAFTRFDKKRGPAKGTPFYRGDMVVLIDAGTMSAGETFARDMVYRAGAHLMGERTAGSSSAKRAWILPDGLGTVTLPTRSRWGFNRQPIEYNGIEPHENVEVVPAELQQGINSGIRRAEEYLERKRKS